MEKYTFITNYQYGKRTSVLQVNADSMEHALFQWIESLDFPYIGKYSKQKLKRLVKSGEIEVTPLRKLHNIGCLYEVINGKILESDVVCHQRNLAKKNLFNIIVLYKGGTYIRQIQAFTPHEAILIWGKYPSWHYYNNLERILIKKRVQNIHTDQIISLVTDVWSLSLVINNEILQIFVVKY